MAKIDFSVIFQVLLSIFLFSLQLKENVGVEQKSVDLFNLAVNKNLNEDNREAFELYQEALNLDWRFPEAHLNIAILYKTSGNYEKAISHYYNAIEFAPTEAFRVNAISYWIEISMRYYGLTNYEQVQHWVTMAESVELPESTAHLRSLLGRLYYHQGLKSKAEEQYLLVTSQSPNYFYGWIQLGNHYFFERRHPEARIAYKRALVELSDPKDHFNIACICHNIAQVYREESNYYEALRYIACSLHSSSNQDRQAYLGTMYAIKGLTCYWQHFEELEDNIKRQLELIYEKDSFNDHEFDTYSALLMRYLPPDIPTTAGSNRCSSKPKYFPNVYLQDKRLTASAAKVPEPLRIGYLSYDWRKHPMGQLTSYLVTHPKGGIEVYCLSYGPNDQSPARLFVSASCSHFIDFYAVLNDGLVAEYIYTNLALDILVDLTTLTFNNRIDISNLRPAPLVVSYLGYPYYTGCKGFDYMMIDRVMAPPDYQHANHRHNIKPERLLYLPHSYQSNNMPLDLFPIVYNYSSYLGGLSLYRQSSQSIHVCILNVHKKIEPLVFHSWMNMLHRNLNIRLLFLNAPASTRQQIRLQAGYHGIDSFRLQFIKMLTWRVHLERIGIYCDLAWDTFVYGAHTTATDLLWMGVPILTMKAFGQAPGGGVPSRVASSIVQYSKDIRSSSVREHIPGSSNSSNSNNARHSRDQIDTNYSTREMDFTWTITETIKEYENAVNLIHQPNVLYGMRQSILAHSCSAPSFDREGQARAVRYAYEAMVDMAFLYRGQGDGEGDRQRIKPHIFLLPQYFPSSHLCEDAVDKMSVYDSPVSTSMNRNVDGYKNGYSKVRVKAEAKMMEFFSQENHVSPSALNALLARLQYHRRISNDDYYTGIDWDSSYSVNVRESKNGSVVSSLLQSIGKLEHWLQLSAKSEDINSCNVQKEDSDSDSDETADVRRETVKEMLFNDEIPSSSTPVTTFKPILFTDYPSLSFLLLKGYFSITSPLDHLNYLKQYNEIREEEMDEQSEAARWLSVDLAESVRRGMAFNLSHAVPQLAAIHQSLSDDYPEGNQAYTFLIFVINQLRSVHPTVSSLYYGEIISSNGSADLRFSSLLPLLSSSLTCQLTEKDVKHLLHNPWELWSSSDLVDFLLTDLRPCLWFAVLSPSSSIPPVLSSYPKEVDALVFLSSIFLPSSQSEESHPWIHEPFVLRALKEMLITHEAYLQKQHNIRSLLTFQWTWLLMAADVPLDHTSIHHLGYKLSHDWKNGLAATHHAPLIKLVDIGFLLLSMTNRIVHFKQRLEYLQRPDAIDPWTNRSQPPSPVSSSKKRIAIFCEEYNQAWWPGWGPKRFESQLKVDAEELVGMGGSEEAAALFAHHLASQGHDVTIFVRIPPEEWNISTKLFLLNHHHHRSVGYNVSEGKETLVRWMSLESFPSSPLALQDCFHAHSRENVKHREEKQRSKLNRRDYDYLGYDRCLQAISQEDSTSPFIFDAFIAWRYSLSLAFSPLVAKRSYLWLHDRLIQPNLPPILSLSLLCQRIFVQSNSHAQAIAKELMSTGEPDKDSLDSILDRFITILPNGAYDYTEHLVSSSPALVKSTMMANQPHRFIYTSSPLRGLHLLLHLWPTIRAEIPTAEIHVYFGITDVVMQALANANPRMTREELARYFEDLLNQPGVVYHGMRGYAELALGYQQAGFFLYPSIYFETGCIAALKAMLHGAIPITSRLEKSVLADLGGPFDLGPSGLFDEEDDKGRYNYTSAGSGANNNNKSNEISCHHCVDNGHHRHRRLIGSMVDKNDVVVEWLKEHYLPCLFRAVKVDPLQLAAHRQEMMDYAKRHFSWNTSTEIFESIDDHPQSTPNQ
eukprot:gene4527-4965_t